MKRCSAIIISLMLAVNLTRAQGPVYTYQYLWTLAYEDLSDILRHYPGMYPLDYGTLGAPILFRPWHLNPWELRLERDLVPQNRRSDGLYDSNLQPASELDTIRYDFLSGYGAGEFQVMTRTLPVDSPYTEFQIREGWHGYGTVDFAHGQRMYRSLTLEMTGRLAWYNGLRPQTESRFQRVRGRMGFDLGKRWRAGITYAGSNVDAEFPGTEGIYTEREEGIFELDEKDTLRTTLSPSLRFYVREDRENWGSAFRLREGVAGLVGQIHASAGAHRFKLKPSATYAEINYPGAPELYETTVQVFAQDSIDIGFLGLRAFGSVRGEVVSNDPQGDSWQLLPTGGVEANAKLGSSLAGFGGVHYVKEQWPVAWAHANYRVGDRPILIAPEFRDLNRIYVGRVRWIDRYRKALAGLRWQQGNTFIEASGMIMDRYGDNADRFTLTDTIVTNDRSDSPDDGKYATALTAQIPLRYGLRIDATGFADLKEKFNREETRTYSRLYFERHFFAAPLTIRSHISHEYIGSRAAYSEFGVYELRPANLIGFRFSATIHGVTLIWGTENFLKQHYQILPGYNMIAKEEYIGVIWRLWL